MIKWFDQTGEILNDGQWNDQEQRTMMRLVKHIDANGSVNTTLTVLHGSETEVEITLPAWQSDWLLLWNSSDEVPSADPKLCAAGSKMTIGPTSILVFADKFGL